MKYLFAILFIYTTIIVIAYFAAGCSNVPSKEYMYTIEIKYIDSEKIDTITTRLRFDPKIYVSTRTRVPCIESFGHGVIACNVRTFQILKREER